MVVSESPPPHATPPPALHLYMTASPPLHTPSLPSVLLFYPFMDVKPVIPIRMKMLQMKAITALVLEMVEWLTVCVCVCARTCARLSSIFLFSPSFPPVLSLHRSQVCW